MRSVYGKVMSKRSGGLSCAQARLFVISTIACMSSYVIDVIAYTLCVLCMIVHAMRADGLTSLYSRLNGCQENKSPVAFSWLLVSYSLAV